MSVDLCTSSTALLSDLCFGRCQVRIPVEVKSAKKPNPKGFLTLGKNKGESSYSACLWRYKNEKEYEKIAAFFIEQCDVITLQAILEKLL